MAKSVVELKLSRPPNVVWEYVVDPDRLRRWRTDILEITSLEKDLEPGDTFNLAKKEGNRRLLYDVTVVTVDKPKKIIFEAKGPKVTVTLDYQLTPSGFGTLFRLEEDIVPRGLLGWIADRYVLPRLLPAAAEQLAANLRSLVDGAGEVRPS